MEGFKLKVSVGGAQIELEGSGDQVVALFQELREKGLGVLGEEMPLEKEKIKEQKEEIPAKTSTEMEEEPEIQKPHLQNIVMQGLPKTEVEWLLIYAVYCSKWGKELFTKEDLRQKYVETERSTETRRKNFSANVKSLVSKRYISVVDNRRFRMEKAQAILQEDRGKRRRSSGAAVSPAVYTPLSLGLTAKERAAFQNFWERHEHSANIDKAVLAAYWLYKNRGLEDFTANHLFTMLREVGENTDFDLSMAIRNGKRKRRYFVSGSFRGAYRLYCIGEDRVKELER